MNSISRTLRFAFLTLALSILIVTPSVSKTPTGKNRSAKQTELRTTNAAGTRSSSQRKNEASTKETLASKKLQVLKAKPREMNRSSQSTKSQLRLEQKRLEARRRAEAERLAAIRAAAAQRAREEELRNQVQLMIAKDDLTGEDREVRRVAIAALGNHAGTVVVMNPQTGRVYSMVNQQWALHEGFKPCSTIKLVTGLAGLNENIIDPTDTTKISDKNQVTLTRALAYSKNDYFQQVGGQVGFDKMISYARRLGLGEKTGINTNNEFPGSVPGSSRSAMLRMWSHGDSFQVTPLQLATLVSAMGNGGKLLKPQLVRTKQDEFSFKTKVRRQVKMDTDTWQQMVPGMVGSVNYGSGRKAYDPRETVAGKTGTCIEQGTWVGLFTSYAPLANPQLAVVVIARGADAHNHFPAAVAGRIYRDLNGRFGTPATLQVATTRTSFTKAEDGDASLDDDGEESESASIAKDWKQAHNIGGISRDKAAVQSVPQKPNTTTANRVVPVLMQIPQRNQGVVRPTSGSVVTPSKVPEVETRPRRVFGER